MENVLVPAEWLHFVRVFDNYPVIQELAITKVMYSLMLINIIL